MDELIQNHSNIINKIKKYILDRHTIQDEFIEIIEGDYCEGHSKPLQIKFISFYTDDIGKIYLNFEIPYKNPKKLRFDSKSGLKTYSKVKDYENLIDDIDYYINL